MFRATAIGVAAVVLNFVWLFLPLGREVNGTWAFRSLLFAAATFGLGAVITLRSETRRRDGIALMLGAGVFVLLAIALFFVALASIPCDTCD